ncbi:MAG: DUF4012 domain-containing protein [Microgenomates group bacterium]
MRGNLENKIELEPVKKPRAFPKKFFIGLGMLLLVIAFLVIFAILPFLEIKSEILDLNKEVKGISAGIQAQNLAQAIEKLGTTKSKLNNLATSYKKLGWVRFIPLASGFYKDGERLIKAGNYLLEAGEIAVEELKPYGDLLGLEKKEEEVGPKELTAEKRLMLALDTLDKLGPGMEKIGEKLERAREETDQINPNRYPEVLFGKKIREKVVTLIKMIDNTAEMAMEIKPIARWLKPLLGFPDEKKYLLLFQNDAELRPTGGFLTAYAILSVHKGNFKPLGSFDIYTLDARFGNRLPPPEPIKKYHKNVYYWHLRDMNLSPDFRVFIETFWPNYKKAGGVDVDGIIAVDTKVLVDLLKALGPIGVADWGRFSAENDPRCNCPQVFYELERLADQPVGTLKTERKAILGPLMHSILLNVMQSPRKKWPEFFNLVFNNIQEKHILFYFFDEELERAIEVLNAGGRIKDYDGDYLHINDCNFAGAKSNMFIRVNVNQDIKIEAGGEIVKTVTIDYKNPEPPSNCNLEAGELCLNGLYRNWVRLYVPKGSELIEVSGSEVEAISYEDLGKTVFEAFYGDKAPLRPQGKAQLVFKYKLPFKIGSDYRILIQKQPGTYGYEYQIRLDGRQERFELKTDRELKLSL